MGSQRTRNYYTVVYPESAPMDWLRRLDDEHIQAFVSPLHQFDVNPDRMVDGAPEPKKPHYHLMLMFEGVKTKDQVKEILDRVCGDGYAGIDVINSFRGYARYLCHLDNPEKYQYSVDEVLSFSGADYLSAIGLPIDKYSVVGDMMDFCSSEKVYSFGQLMRYAKLYRVDWFRSLCDNTAYVMTQYLKSIYWEDNNYPESFQDDD